MGCVVRESCDGREYCVTSNVGMKDERGSEGGGRKEEWNGV